MGGIFISYRRDDSAPYARLLADVLGERFGQSSIFRDIDTIRPGTNFADAIQTAVATCDALVVVIGKEWLTVKNATGQRRLDDPEDYVRLEVLAGLQRDDVLVVPVLVEGAPMPPTGQLPPALAPLSERMALELNDAGWNYQVGQLVEVLTTVIAPAKEPDQPPGGERGGSPQPVPGLATDSTRRRYQTIAVAALLVVTAVAGATLLIRPWARSGTEETTSATSTTGVATTGPAETGPLPLEALELRAGSGFTVQVPRNWRHSDEPSSEPGAAPAEVWTDPRDPNRRLRVVGSRCASCATTEGSPDVSRLVPNPVDRSNVLPSKTFATYDRFDGTNPFRNHGTVRIYVDGPVVKGYYRVDVWLPEEMRPTATLILNSFTGRI